MKLGEVASQISIDPRKLMAYALNPSASRGRHLGHFCLAERGQPKHNVFD